MVSPRPTPWMGCIQNQCKEGVPSFTPRYSSIPVPTRAIPTVIGNRDPISGASTPTQLQSLLPPDVERLVVVGLAGDYCVKETALDGKRLGYDVEAPLALTRFVNLEPGDDDRTVEELRAAGVDVS